MANEKGKGPQLEYKIIGLFQKQGYLARRSIPLHYGKNNQDATDIDIIGFLFTHPFQMHKVICDCKNKQRSKPYERIFWAKGLGEFVGANDVYVALPQASWETVRFAQKGDVRILSFDSIDSNFSSSLNSYGIADDDFYMDFFDKINIEIKQNKKLSELWNSLRKLYLNDDPYVNLNISMELLYKVGQELKFWKYKGKNQNYLSWEYLCCEIIVVISLNILRICSDTICLSPKAREQHILLKLTYGDIDPTKVNTILHYAKNVANEMVKANVPKGALPSTSVVDFGDISAPSYAYDIIGLVERAIRNQEWYIDLPQVLDFILYEFVIKNKAFSIDEYRKNINSIYADEKLKAAKNILFFVKNSCGINFNILWEKSDELIIKNHNETTKENYKLGKEENKNNEIV